MALIGCPECGREVSSSAATCPECAFPLAPGARTPSTGGRTLSRQPWWKTAFPIIGRLAIGFVLLAGGLEEESVAGVIGATLIGVSAIPVWYRHKLDSLRAQGTDRALAARLEERMIEMEDRHREELAQFGRLQAEKLADLEERIDFTERLLTK